MIQPVNVDVNQVVYLSRCPTGYYWSIDKDAGYSYYSKYRKYYGTIN
jgi:hypothetical protein